MLGKLKKHIINVRGKSLDRKLLVFESDDWGSIRIPNKKALQTLQQDALISKSDPFSKYDTLESSNDFEALFEVLAAFKDKNQNPPIITANTVVANPDFEKIKSDNYHNYYFETFDQTYKKYQFDTAFSSFQEGISNKFLYPQFHAREHLNVSMWMDLLRKEHQNFRKAFELECFSIDFKDKSNKRGNLMAAYDHTNPLELAFIEESIRDGLSLFHSFFGFKSETTIAPCYVWDDKIEHIFLKNGVQIFQGSKYQNFTNNNKFEKRFHFNGDQNQANQCYLVRNGLFEPSLSNSINWVEKCLESIEIAFMWNKPAIIGTHRINFVGGLDENNRHRNLQLLSLLLTKVLKKWPEIEFVSSADVAKEYI